MLDKITFSKGLDSDSEVRTIQKGSYRYALNIQQYENGVIQNLAGNTLVSIPLKSGDYKCIGALDDITNNKVYYFLWNSLSSHLILEYNATTNLIATVLNSTLLNFDKDHLITGVNVIDGLLFWTDDINPPRKVNIEKAKNNQYPTPFAEEYMQAIKYPPMCQPDVVYASDNTKNINLLENKLFQFKYQFVYDDNEKSAWSAISVVPFPSISCGDLQSAYLNNNINVTVGTGSGICTRIRIAGRIGNTGDFFLITDLNKSELLIGDNTTYQYAFYNDGNYTNLEINESIKLYDNLPLLAKAQELIEGTRLVYGNTVDGFDQVEVNAKIDWTLNPQPSSKGFNISGRILIRNPFANSWAYSQNQPIIDYNDNLGAGFGGFGTSPNNVTTIISDYGQSLPLKGFVLYLAGTDYYGVSKQITQANGGTQDSFNVYLADSISKRNKIRDEINAQNCYSTWSINGILPGRYVLRVASHLTTQSDLNSASRSYQNTSTNTFFVCGENDVEIDLEVRSTGEIYVNGVSRGYSGYLGDTLIMDLTNPNSLAKSIAMSGYVTDADIQPAPTSASGLLADTRIEQATVLMSVTLSGFGYNGIVNNYQSSTVTADWTNKKARTDHNGFFFWTARATGNNNISVLTLSQIQVGSNNTPLFSKYDSSGAVFVPSNQTKLSSVIFRASSQGQFDAQRTILNGTITDSGGTGLKNVSVVVGHGRKDVTDTNGDFNIIVYGTSWNGGGFSRADKIYYSINGSCIATFSTAIGNVDYFSFAIVASATGQLQFASPYSGSYNYTLTCQLGIAIASVVGGTSVLSHGRGCTYQYGIAYMNAPNQSSTVFTNNGDYNVQVNNIYGLRLYIPYYTEIDPNTSQIYGQGRPDVSMSIYHQPPDWATHYQIYRTLESGHNKRLQWTAKTVVYTDDNRNSVSFSQATKIGFSIQNIIDYNTTNTDSLVDYDYTPGDRIKLIRDQNGNFFNTFVDVKIRDFDPAGIIYIENPQGFNVQLQPGVEFEVYTPKLKTDTEVWFEFGECFEVGNAGTSSRYHKGLSQDQSTVFNNNVSTSPAVIELNGTDTYYRLRRIPDSNGIKVIYVEDNSFSDFYSSLVQNIGRPNRVDKDARRVRRYSTIWWSEKYIPETKINGLNSFFDVNFETYDHSWRSIQKLYSHDQRLDIYFELKVGQVLVNQVQFNDLNNQSLVGASADVLSKQVVYYQGEFGIGKNPESFARFGPARYFVDINRGSVLQLSNDGITVVSDYNMINFWAEQSDLIISTGVQPKIYGCFNRGYKEYVISIEDIYDPNGAKSDPPIYEGFTIAFNSVMNASTSFYSYRPDFMASNGVGMVSWKDGQLYTHDDNILRNNFYGVQYGSEVIVISNDAPSNEKIWEAISIESPDVWECPSITTPRGQQSNLISSDFEQIKNMQYAPFWNDTNTPNVNNPLTEGDKLFDTTLTVKLTNDLTTITKLFSVNVNWIANELSNR